MSNMDGIFYNIGMEKKFLNMLIKEKILLYFKNKCYF